MRAKERGAVHRFPVKVSHERLATWQQTIDAFSRPRGVADVGHRDRNRRTLGNPEIKGGSAAAVGVLSNGGLKCGAYLTVGHGSHEINDSTTIANSDF